MDGTVKTLAYASFWQRFGAAVVDALLLIPFAFVVLATLWAPAPLAVAILLLGCAAGPAYSIYAHGRFGQTIGKWFFGIRVHMVDGARATWRAIWIRHSPDVALATISAIGVVYIHASLLFGELSHLTFMKALEASTATTPTFFRVVDNLETLWIWSEVVVMLLNEKRQALHDLMARTVVIRVAD